MANLNRIILVGRLTVDPEARTTLEGNPFTRFTLAVDRPPRADGSKETDFIPIVTWRNLAEVSGKYLKKGRLVLIDGWVQIRNFEDQTGQRKWVTEVVARNMKMLDKSGEAVASDLTPESPGEPRETSFSEIETPWEAAENVQ